MQNLVFLTYVFKSYRRKTLGGGGRLQVKERLMKEIASFEPKIFQYSNGFIQMATNSTIQKITFSSFPSE